MVHPDATVVLRELTDRNYIVGLGSNFDARLLPLIHAFPELTPVREHCIISSLVGWRKPSPSFSWLWQSRQFLIQLRSSMWATTRATTWKEPPRLA